MKPIFWSCIVSFLGLCASHPLDDMVSSLDLSTGPTNSLLSREDPPCELWDQGVAISGGYTEYFVYTTTGGHTAWLVCKKMGYSDCVSIGVQVGLAMLSIFFLVDRFGGGQNGAFPANHDSRSIIEGVPSMLEHLPQAFSKAGIDFAHIENATHLVDEALYIRDSNVTAKDLPKEIVNLHGISYGNITTDLQFLDFGGGNGQIHIPGPNQNSLGKRSTERAPGFKVSFTTRKAVKLSEDQERGLASRLGAFWAERARTNRMHDFIGFVKYAHTANFYFRIIPETVSFGLNYETVDSCGPLAKFL